MYHEIWCTEDANEKQKWYSSNHSILTELQATQYKHCTWYDRATTTAMTSMQSHSTSIHIAVPAVPTTIRLIRSQTNNNTVGFNALLIKHNQWQRVSNTHNCYLPTINTKFVMITHSLDSINRIALKKKNATTKYGATLIDNGNQVKYT